MIVELFIGKYELGDLEVKILHGRSVQHKRGMIESEVQLIYNTSFVGMKIN